MSDSPQEEQDDAPKVFTARPRPNRRPRVVTPPPARRRGEDDAEEASDAAAEHAAG